MLSHRLKPKNFLVFLAASLMLLGSCSKQGGTVYLSDFISQNSEISDHTHYFRAALDKCRKIGAAKLILGEGIYHLRADKAYERYVFVSNNDEGLKRILFDLSDMKNFEIDGTGAHLLFTGFISPFLLNNSENITIKGLSIDYTRTFHSEGLIEAAGDGWIDVRFDEAYPYSVADGTLNFQDRDGVRYTSTNMLEFDSQKREPAWRASDYWINTRIVATHNPDGSVRVFKDKLMATPGNIMVFGAGKRDNPAITISDSRDVLISNVTIYHSGGMGVIAQRSANIELNGVKVTPAERRVVSASADATHFVNCEGYIRMINCLFENQKDDATNIHGIYPMITEINGNKVILKLMHSQQHGFDFIKPGMTMEFVDRESLITYGEAKVASVVRLNKEYTEVSFAGELPGGVKPKDPVASIDVYPVVLIKGCTMRNNRARGLLLGSRGKTVIEDNFFHIPGASILFEGDGSYWYEQSGVREVMIRNNVFENCMYGYFNWGSATIATGSGIRKDREISRYNRNITVEGNIFRGFDPRLVNLYCVDGFIFRNNTIEKTDDYPADKANSEAIITRYCDNILIEK